MVDFEELEIEGKVKMLECMVNDMEENKKMLECTVNDLVEKVKMLECTVNDMEENKKMLECMVNVLEEKVKDMEENKKMLECKKSAAAWYSIATPDLKDEDKNLFVLVFGLPGSVKSSALSKAMMNYEGGEYKTSPIKHVVFNFEGNNFVHLGSLRDQYPGTDSLPYNHQPIKDFIREIFNQTDSHIIAEGQRLTSSRFLEHVASWYNIVVVYIEVDENTAASRAHLLGGFGKEYKPMFLKKVMGAIHNIKPSMPHNFRLVDGTQSVDSVAEDIKRIVMNRL